MNEISIEKLLENVSSGVIVCAPDASVIYVNEAAGDILKVYRDEILGKYIYDLDWKIVDASGNYLDTTQLPFSLVHSGQKESCEMLLGIEYPEGESNVWIWARSYLDSGRTVTTFIDVTDKYRLPFQQIIDKATNAVIVTTAENNPELNGPEITYVNDSFSKLTGYTEKELIGNTPKILQGEDTDQRRLYALKKAIQHEASASVRIVNYTKEGRAYWVDLSIFPLKLGFRNKTTHFAGITHDVTKLKEAEIAQREAAEKDHLTNLFNRRGFDSITQGFDHVINQAQEYAIIMIDIDFFKNVNDKYSHAHGDEVIKNLAETMKEYCRDDDTGVRLGGEEFAILIVDSDKENALKVAERLRESVEKQVVSFEGAKINYTISCGVADSKASNNIEECLHHADEALYNAKSDGRNRCEVY